jgi:hypothetical protein
MLVLYYLYVLTNSILLTKQENLKSITMPQTIQKRSVRTSNRKVAVSNKSEVIRKLNEKGFTTGEIINELHKMGFSKVHYSEIYGAVERNG